ncbi:MAG: prepilin-type N-terminal cleavage/methylation domain-containing protein [Candidatus Brocadiia bacterium]
MNNLPRYSGPPRASTDGFTVMEMLVAMTVFLILGAALASFMNYAISAYSINRARTASYSSGMAILGQFESDVSQAFLAPGDRNENVDVRFLGNKDATGNTSLIFVASSRNPLESRTDLGLREIAWNVDATAGAFPLNICRTQRDGVGGPESLFTKRPQPGTFFASNVGFFEVRFFPDMGSLVDENVTFTPDEVNYGLPSWDSTRGDLSSFKLYTMNSLLAPWDDIMMERIAVTLTIIPNDGMRTVLTSTLDANSSAINVDITDGFPPNADDMQSYLLIDSEWIKFTTSDLQSFTAAPGGRGARNTTATSHNAGAIVRAGFTFYRTVYIACRGKAAR